MSRACRFLRFVPLLALGAACQAAPEEEGATSSSPAPQGRIVYQATPPPAYGTSGEPPPTPGVSPPAVRTGDATPATAGQGVEIISGGGGGSPGAARVGRMPILQ